MANIKLFRYDAEKYYPTLVSRAVTDSRLGGVHDDSWSPPVETKITWDDRGFVEIVYRVVDVVDSTS